jgi:hypothetical protein
MSDPKQTFLEEATSNLPSWVDKGLNLESKQEKGFVRLLKDLKDNEKLKSVYDSAVRGTYSDQGSPLTFPSLALISRFEKNGSEDLLKKAKNGQYEHDYVYFKNNNPSNIPENTLPESGDDETRKKQEDTQNEPIGEEEYTIVHEDDLAFL